MPRKSPPITRYTGNLKGKAFNTFFSKIFIVNLEDRVDRFQKVTKQFRTRGIKYERYIAVDGRCKTTKECNAKRKIFEDLYDVQISRKLALPAASLTIGTIEILRKMVKNRWKRVLICEDDIVFGRTMTQRFKAGVEELKNVDWDLLYLGCGGKCGHKNVSHNRTSRARNLTSWNISDPDLNFYVGHKDDLRTPCEKEDCYPITKNISQTESPGGTWCYAFTLEAAKRFLDVVDGKVRDHIDQLLIKLVQAGELEAVAFDPPIVWHEKGAVRPDSDIPW